MPSFLQLSSCVSFFIIICLTFCHNICSRCLLCFLCPENRLYKGRGIAFLLFAVSLVYKIMGVSVWVRVWVGGERECERGYGVRMPTKILQKQYFLECTWGNSSLEVLELKENWNLQPFALMTFGSLNKIL